MDDEIRILAFDLSDDFTGHHKALLDYENLNSYRVAEWRRVAQFILDHPEQLPRGENAVDETAKMLAGIFLRGAKITDDYWRRTKGPWHVVATRALQMQPR